MDTPTIRPATLHDAAMLAPQLRPEDVQEIDEATGQTPLQSLLAAVRSSSWSKAVLDGEGVPMALFGVTPSAKDPERVGVPWLLMDARVLTVVSPFWVARQARKHLKEMHSTFPHLYNVVSAWNTIPIQWLYRLGFQFTVVHPYYGAAQTPFLQFERIHHV